MNLWNTKAFGKSAAAHGYDKSLNKGEVVILMQGKNNFGDRIYSYLKITLDDMERMKNAIMQGKSFNPSDYGSVVAAGQGEPTPEVKAEVAQLYTILDPLQQVSVQPKTHATASKAWDEY